MEVAEAEGEPIYDPLWHINQSVSQDKPPKLKPLPTIVIVADEFADMIMQLGKTAEEPIVRLAQKSTRRWYSFIACYPTPDGECGNRFD